MACRKPSRMTGQVRQEGAGCPAGLGEAPQAPSTFLNWILSSTFKPGPAGKEQGRMGISETYLISMWPPSCGRKDNQGVPSDFRPIEK
jgi:hypothetical protein